MNKQILPHNRNNRYNPTAGRPAAGLVLVRGSGPHLRSALENN
ncbi:MAG: hypothetical protein ACI9G1_001822 [Pirellulaceae bacterium]|jgi:hypothetical protein